MFEKILVPMDRSLLAEHILPHAIAIAQAHNSEITLISVLDSAIGSNPDSPINPFDWQIQRAEAEAYLKNVASGLAVNGLAVRTILLDGKASDEVIQYSESMDSDLIMLSSHGQEGNSSWNSSSAVMKIIQQAHTSVMMIRSSSAPESSHANLRYRRILAPVDGSKRAEYGLFAAAHLARKHGAELMIAYVIKPPELPRRIALSTQDHALVQSVVESNRVEGSLYLNNLKKSLDCHVESCLVISESVTEALHTMVEQEKIDLIVLNAHGLGGNPRWPYGNVTVNFLAYSAIPTLIVQDFDRIQLIQSQIRTNVKELWSQQRPISDLYSPSFIKRGSG